MNSTFSFGKNWEGFIDSYLTEERIAISKEHILRFLGRNNLEGKYVLDVGCGSGLSSLAAIRARATRVVSFDIDPYSVETTQRLRNMERSPSNWAVLQGSVLDRDFLSTLEPADIVYSWGVLHHTGSMWQAIKNTMSLVKPDGLIYIALYTTTPESPYWTRIKRDYNRTSWLGRRILELWYITKYTVVPQLRIRRSPIEFMRNYKRTRGMAYLTDVRDWLGGWPYEDATEDEVKAFFEEHGFSLVRIDAGEANAEYLFKPNPRLILSE